MNQASPPFPVLFSNADILRRTHELARELHAALGDEPPCLIQVVEGARPFARLLQQAFEGQALYDVRAKSYAGTESTGEVRIDLLGGLGREVVAGREVVLIEDIVDTGRTIAALRQRFLEFGARRVRVASLLSKPSRRVVEVEVEHVGFEIPDEFVLGFGMDLDERYRELPDVVVYDAEVERAFSAAEA
ncbi:MAG: phosphoribosyltransferase family protein [Planctomycetota bacterium]|nr:phosphoribosyltransferase family protein [Planctomycetota bacterium]MEC8653767.1 phosphoribosyltransferase family protein [Planctomycetota bacterium]MEC9048317.1 phosphoribosyltransferase family protein [Planctomycetota bacterium]